MVDANLETIRLFSVAPGVLLEQSRPGRQK